MANIDLTELMSDPDFIDDVYLVRQAVAVGTNGRATVTPTTTEEVMSVQSPNSEQAKELPEGTRLEDSLVAYFFGELHPLAPGRTADIVIPRTGSRAGRRFAVDKLIGDWSNWGAGWCCALCIAEVTSATG